VWLAIREQLPILVVLLLFLWGHRSSNSPRLRRFKTHQDEIWQDYSSCKYASIKGVGFSICRHIFKIAATTSFQAEKCCHLVSLHAASLSACCYSCLLAILPTILDPWYIRILHEPIPSRNFATWRSFTDIGIIKLPAHIRIHFIFLETRIIGLHFASNGIDLSSVVNRLVAQLWKTSSLALPCPAEESQTGLVLCHDA